VEDAPTGVNQASAEFTLGPSMAFSMQLHIGSKAFFVNVWYWKFVHG